MRKAIITSILFVIIFPLCIYSQRTSVNVDSLETLLKQSVKTDTVRAKVLFSLAGALFQKRTDPERAITLTNECISLSDSLKYNKILMRSYILISQYYIDNGEYPKAAEGNLKALTICEENKFVTDKVRVLRNMGVINYGIKSYDTALRYYFDALKEAKAQNMKNDIAGIESNIGILYQRQGKYDEAQEFYEMALKTAEENNNKRTKSYVLNSMGSLYNEKGTINNDRKQFDIAIKYFKLSLSLKKEINDKKGEANALGNIGNAYLGLKMYGEALKFLKDGEQVATESGYKEWFIEAYQSMSICYELSGDTKNGLKFFKKYVELKDTIASMEAQESISKLQGTYETEKRDKEIELLHKDNELQSEKLSRQNTVIISGIVGLLISFGFVFFIFRSYKEKKQSHALLSEQNKLIVEQKAELELQKKHVVDSINYASKIQNSILPSIKHIKEYLPNTFISYKPKDIVSGDFYWFMHKNNFSFYAVADCTGHGVPGAFMSLVSGSLLSEIINAEQIIKPSLILAKLHKLIYQTFKQEKGDKYAQDGLDISLIVYNHETKKVFFAGARNSLIVVRNGVAEMIPATQKSIGGLSIINTSEPERKFEEKEVVLSKGDLMILFTDGVLDMFNSQQQKYGIERLKGLSQLLWKKEDVAEMRAVTDKEFEFWLQNEIQVDDILLSGIRF